MPWSAAQRGLVQCFHNIDVGSNDVFHMNNNIVSGLTLVLLLTAMTFSVESGVTTSNEIVISILRACATPTTSSRRTATLPPLPAKEEYKRDDSTRVEAHRVGRGPLASI